MRPAGVARHLAEEEVLDAADEARPLLEPVERIEDESLDLLPAVGLRHYARISGIGQSQNSGPSTCWPGLCSLVFLIWASFPVPSTFATLNALPSTRWPLTIENV